MKNIPLPDLYYLDYANINILIVLLPVQPDGRK